MADDDVVINLRPSQPRATKSQFQQPVSRKSAASSFSASSHKSPDARKPFIKRDTASVKRQLVESNAETLTAEGAANGAAPAKTPAYKRKVGVVKKVVRENVEEAPRKLASHEGTTRTDSDTFSGTSFRDTEISSDFLDHLETMKLTVMTHIQVATVPAMLKGSDILMKAQTGTGKTLAFSIPIVEDLAHQPERLQRGQGTHALIVAPTRELCLQIDEVIGTLLKPYHWIVHGTIIGGEKKKAEKARLRKGVCILGGTPGRLLDHLTHTESFVVTQLKFLVLDEADRLLDLGFEKDVSEIIRIVDERRRQKRRQSVLVSATLDTRVMGLAQTVLHRPKTVSARATPGDQFILREAGKRVREDGREDAGTVVASGSSTAALDAYKNAEDDDEDSESDREGSGKPRREKESFELPQRLRQHFVVVPGKQRLNTLGAFLRGRMMAAGSTKCLVFCSCIAVVQIVHLLLSRAWVPQWKQKRSSDWSQNEWMQGEEEEDEMMAEIGSKFKPRRKKSADSDDEEKEPESSDPFLNTNLYVLHGDLPQQERTKTFFSFCHASSGVLFCTDVAARGLDFPLVDWIVQYDVPSDPKDYVHRCGRTARMTHDGDALLFLMPHEREYVNVLAEKKLVLQELPFETVQAMIVPRANLTPTTNSNPTLRRRETSEMAAVLTKRLQHQFEDIVSTDTDAYAKATNAFLSFVRAYATHAKDVKEFFHVKKLHLGHMAASFGLRDAPQILSRHSGAPKHQKKKINRPGKRARNGY